MLLHVLHLGLVGQEGINRHDDARGAKAALRTVHVDHGRLEGVETTSHGADALDGRDVGGISGQHRHEAGIGGIVENFLLGGVPSGDHDGAGSASALGTSQLGTGEAQNITQVREQSLSWSGLGSQVIGDALAVDVENGGGPVSSVGRIEQLRVQKGAVMK